jgi:hypothetical protein
MPAKKPVWERPRPKGLGKPKKLPSKVKAAAKREATRKGQVYPSLVANMNAAKKARVR